MRRKIEVEFAIDDSKAFKIAERMLDQFYNRQGFFPQLPTSLQQNALFVARAEDLVPSSSSIPGSELHTLEESEYWNQRTKNGMRHL